MEIPAEVESYRDRLWRREEVLKISDAASAETMIDDLGFCLGLTDVRTPLPSLYLAVCGRRDAHMPKNVQKDPEVSMAWNLKDDVMRRGKVYYSKLTKGRATFVSKRLVPHFKKIYGIPSEHEAERLTPTAMKVLEVLREEWESSTSDLREEAEIENRKDLTKALDELQRCMKVVPYEVLYEPKFTYLWTLAEERFPEEIAMDVTRDEAVEAIAEAFLRMQGFTEKGALSKATGISRAEAGAANQRLVEREVAIRVSPGVYRLNTKELQIQ
ncbi:MAG: hypothetical protein DWQ47_00335 [Acidobacteria bacterium]|nr:MAG: hypothetical protein DWQ32_10795 [Acidobacteriota bacterium]REK03959.1 MAG: hypothetical protein DWQ38_00320 [Acidobacteriota bacterium]REK15121.1 MAG: hypothetical protein DWQ43_16485 [Acidobacteriota bacterium]REK46211.1 MAG: hypothetical protein DWQ47_00335 [Acidobacteriota bacterium]